MRAWGLDSGYGTFSIGKSYPRPSRGVAPAVAVWKRGSWLDGQRRTAADGLDQLLDFDRLDQVQVEARFEHAAAVLGQAVAGQRDQPHVACGRIGAQAPRHLVAVDAGQADVDQQIG